MKTFAAVTIAMIIGSTGIAAGQCYFADSAAYVCAGATKAAESYIPALASANTGVLESALAHVAMVKLTIPGCELNSVRACVLAIERGGATKEVRYKAWVVRSLMDNPERFEGIPKTGYDEPDALIAALANRMAARYAAI